MEGLGSGCKRGEIRRVAYTRKDGVYVPSGCIPRKAKPGPRRKILPKPKAGALGGWTKDLPEDERHKVLKAVTADEGCRTVIGNLNLLANFTKRQSPDTHRKARADMAWLRRQNFCELKTKA